MHDYDKQIDAQTVSPQAGKPVLDTFKLRQLHEEQRRLLKRLHEVDEEVGRLYQDPVLARLLG